jgi:hypothetical protein
MCQGWGGGRVNSSKINRVMGSFGLQIASVLPRGQIPSAQAVQKFFDSSDP